MDTLKVYGRLLRKGHFEGDWQEQEPRKTTVLQWYAKWSILICNIMHYSHHAIVFQVN